jgi:hypothetical protein
MEGKYFVWVGGTYHVFDDPVEALIEKNKWLASGYTEVQVTTNNN